MARSWKATKLFSPSLPGPLPQDRSTCLTACNNIQHDIWRKQNMAVFNSLLKPDCLASGHLINELGYRYNGTFNVESCGTINLVNSLAAIKKRGVRRSRHHPRGTQAGVEGQLRIQDSC